MTQRSEQYYLCFRPREFAIKLASLNWTFLLALNIHNFREFKMESNLLFLSSSGVGERLTPLGIWNQCCFTALKVTISASPVTRFTFDDGFRPLTNTKQSALKKPGLGGQNMSPSKNRKHVRFSGINQKVSETGLRPSHTELFQIFYPVAQMYHLDSWPSCLRYSEVPTLC